jgi:broad specificity phosphatase PhoE
MLFDVTIASPLNRAMETAQILTEGHMEIIPCHYAQERNYGVLQGLTSADVESIRPPIHFIKVGGDYHSLNPPKAETFEEVRARGERLHRYILTHHMGRRVLLVSHGVFLQQFHGVLRRQNWVEALAAHVGNLELNIFHLKDDSVLSEDRFRLTDHKQVDF